jgi:ribonuclease P/MRP protein subunit POP7
VRAYLSHIESRAAGPITLPNGTSKRLSQKVIKSSIEDGIEKARGGGEWRGKGEEVMLKATGKAIERLLGVALFFQGEEGVKVEVRTGSVGAVDDVVEKKSGAEMGESQVRRTSFLEVAVRLV